MEEERSGRISLEAREWEDRVRGRGGGGQA